MGSSSSMPLIDKPNEKELSGYDIPNINSNNFKNFDENTINFLFDQFKYKYNDFYTKRAHKNQEEVDIDSNMRKNISVLVIVGSSFQIAKPSFFEGKYLENAEDLDTALLIRHLFHYAFGVPTSQILITSTQKNDFKTKGINDDLIPAPNPIFNGINDINPITQKQENDKINPNNFNSSNSEDISSNEDQLNEQAENYKFEIPSKEEFFIFQNINLAQVGTKQYKFYFNENIEKVIKPFNIHIIKQELSTNDDSHLFVFFLRSWIYWRI